MITFANAKINLGLNITEKRKDGYHNLETIFYPIPLSDAIEVVPNDSQETHFHSDGIQVEGSMADNLIVKAFRLLQHEYDLPHVDIAVLKNIPTGAGLGGGSSDASFTLKLLNEMFHLDISVGQLEAYAASLGADCAFFIQNKPTYAEGIGNIFSPISLSLKGYQLHLVKPDIFVSTKEAFAHITPQRPTKSVKEIVRQPISTWKKELKNDFEESIFPHHPEIEAIKRKMYDNGAIYAAMSGSGSSVFGIYPADATLSYFQIPDSFEKIMTLE